MPKPSTRKPPAKPKTLTLPSGTTVFRPTQEQLRAAVTKKVPDLVAPDLEILFCGINPGLYTAATGHHFAGPGNRFWPTIHAAGFTPRLLHAFEEAELLPLGFGITNLCSRTTATADQLTKQELVAGGKALRRKVLKYSPKILAVVGLVAYRVAFERPKAVVGLQDDRIGSTYVWLLPNPSGLNAHHQDAALVELFAELRRFADSLRSPSG